MNLHACFTICFGELFVFILRLREFERSELKRIIEVAFWDDFFTWGA